MKRYTIADFNRQFPNDDACLEWIKNHVYPNGIACKSCGKVTSHSKLSKIPVYSCNRCGVHTHPSVGTIFEGSRTPLKSWFYAMFLMSHTRCGISAKQLQRELGVTYKTAWRMFKEIRSLLQDAVQPMSGQIEVDETYIGGRRHGRRGRGAEGKMPVFGITQRQGEVSATRVNDLKSSTVYPLIKRHVLPQSMRRRFDGHVHLIQTDGGPEFKADFLTNVPMFCHRHRIARPYRKNEQSYIESFNRTVRKECLGWNNYRLRDLKECTEMVESFLKRYHYHRPHMGLGMRPPLTSVKEVDCRIFTEN